MAAPSKKSEQLHGPAKGASNNCTTKVNEQNRLERLGFQAVTTEDFVAALNLVAQSRES
jgi:hypothetical protein